jgi:hypothetical protein
MTESMISKLIKDNLVIEITDKGILLSTNEISTIQLDSINDITDELIHKLSENNNNR